MKVVICGDSHIGAIYGLGYNGGNNGNSRVDDYENTLNNIVDHCIREDVSVFIQTGDVFDIRNPLPEHLAVMNRAIKKLSMANISSFIIMGNHDYKRNSDGVFTSSISSLAAKEYANCRVVLEPQIVNVYDKNNDGLNLLLLPYRDRRMYHKKSCELDSKAYEEHIESILKTRNTEYPTIAVGHNFFFDKSYSEYSGLELLPKISCFSDCDMVTMGHYHEFKILSKKSPIAIYSGSMEKINFGDQKIDKYFIEYETTTKKTNIIKSKVRELEDIVLDLENSDLQKITENIERMVKCSDVKDKIVRLNIKVKDTLASMIKKSEIEKILKDKGAFYISKIIIEPVVVRTNKTSLVLKQKDNVSMFEAFLSEQEVDSSSREQILETAKKIIGV